MGDDTWMMLFPNAQTNTSSSSGVAHDAASEFHTGYWTEAHPFESFNVKDLHSVDEGVLEHLLPTIVNGTMDVRSKQRALRQQAKRCACAPRHPHGSQASTGEGKGQGQADSGDTTDPSAACNCEHIAWQLRQLHASDSRGWDVLVAHFLGVDHVGHTHGPTHHAMQSKLHQMDNVLSDVYAALPGDCLLVVMGDHGMTAQGNHGGNTAEEVTAALMLMAKRPLSALPQASQSSATHVLAQKALSDQSGGYLGALREQLGLRHGKLTDSASSYARPVPRVKQVDIVPTLSTLMGLPIPFGNLGRLMPDLQYGTVALGNASTRTEQIGHLQALLKGLQLNAEQIIRFINAYEQISSDFSAAAVASLHTQLGEAAGLAQRTVPADIEMHLEAIGAYARFLESAFDECRAVWAQFDVASMLVGVATTWLVEIALFCAASAEDKGMRLMHVSMISACAAGFAFLLDAVAVSALLARLLQAALAHLRSWQDSSWSVLAPILLVSTTIVQSFESSAVYWKDFTGLWVQHRLPTGLDAEERFSSMSALLHATGLLPSTSGTTMQLVAAVFQPIVASLSRGTMALCAAVPAAMCAWPAEVLSSLVLFDEGTVPAEASHTAGLEGDSADEGVSLPGGHAVDASRTSAAPSIAPNMFGALCVAVTCAWAGQYLVARIMRRRRQSVHLSAVTPYRDEEEAQQPRTVNSARARLPLADAVRHRLPQLCAVVVFFRCVALFGNSGIEAELEVLTFLVATVQIGWIISAVVHKAWSGAAWLVFGLALMRAASAYGKLLLSSSAPPQHTPVWEHFSTSLGETGMNFAPWALCIIPGTLLTAAALLVPLMCNVCGARGVSTRHAGASFGRGLNGVLNALAGLLALVAWLSAVQYWSATASSFPPGVAISFDPTLPPSATANGWVLVACSSVLVGIIVLAVTIFFLPLLPCCKPRHGGRFPVAATDAELEAAMKPSIPCENKLFALTSCGLALPLLALLLGPGSVPVLLLLGFAAAATAAGGWTTVLFQAHAATMDGMPRGDAMAQALWPASVIMALAGPFAFHATGHATKLSALQYSAAFVGFETFDFWRSGAALALNTAGGHVMVALAAGPLLPARTWRSLRVAGVLQTQASFVHLLALACTITWLVLSRRHLMVWAIFAPKFIFELFFLLLWVLGIAAWLVCGRPGGQTRRLTPDPQVHEHAD